MTWDSRPGINGALERLQADNERLRGAIEAIKKATVEGRVCDDVAWFDDITTLYDFCELVLLGPNAFEQGTKDCGK